MARDDTKLSYYSGWDIDQLVAKDTVAVGAGTTAIFTYPTNLPAVPLFDVQFQPTASTKFYQSGAYSTNGTFAGVHQFSCYVQAGQIFIKTDIAGTAKYFVWSDKVDY
jgi:hypothetical protein